MTEVFGDRATPLGGREELLWGLFKGEGFLRGGEEKWRE